MERKMILIENANIGYGEKVVLHDFNLNVEKGEFIGIIGASGAGKSTLLSTLIGNVKIFDGSVKSLDFDIAKINKKEMMALRRRIGFIFQSFNLVDRMKVLDNIVSGMLPDISLHRALLKYYSKDTYEKSYEMLKVVGLAEKALDRCDQLSGGQRQRVAIARALAQSPDIILADEPVAALDPVSAENVMRTLTKVNSVFGVTVVTNLHQLEVAREYCRRVIGINAGRIVFDGKPEALTKKVVDAIYCCTPEATGTGQDDCVFAGLGQEAGLAVYQ